MNFFSLFSEYKRVIEGFAFLAIVLAVGIALHHFLEYEREIGRNEIRVEYAQKLQAATENALQREMMLNKRIQEAQNASIKRDEIIANLSRSASKSSDGLRDALNTISRGLPEATLNALRETSARLAKALGECQERYPTVATDADSADSDKRTLMDAWSAN